MTKAEKYANEKHCKKKNELYKSMEMIKQYCIEITEQNKNCVKCIFYSEGYNGCKLQTSPNNWE